MNEGNVERLLPYFVAGAIAIFLIGFVAAKATNAMIWVEKSGKVMVALSLMLTFVQFRYESQFGRRFAKRVHVVKQLAADKGMTRSEAEAAVNLRSALFRFQFEEMRRRVLLHALLIAAIGELVSAFGGIVASWVGP